MKRTIHKTGFRINRALPYIAAILITLSVIGYAVLRAQTIVTGPQITIDTPKNGELINDALLEIIGSAKNISTLYLNGRKIFTDDTGRFSEKLLLSYGYNIIEISAEDRFKRKTTKKLELLFK